MAKKKVKNKKSNYRYRHPGYKKQNKNKRAKAASAAWKRRGHRKGRLINGMTPAKASQVRRKIENKWYRSMRAKGWRLRYGMLSKKSLWSKGKHKQQDREEKREVNRLRKMLKKAGVIKANGKFYIWS